MTEQRRKFICPKCGGEVEVSVGETTEIYPCPGCGEYCNRVEVNDENM